MLPKERGGTRHSLDPPLWGVGHELFLFQWHGNVKFDLLIDANAHVFDASNAVFR